MFNMVKGSKPEVNVCKNAPLNVSLLLPPHQTDVRSFANAHKFPLSFVVFVTKVVMWVVRIVHSHVTDRILALTCTNVLKKLTFQVKNDKKK